MLKKIGIAILIILLMALASMFPAEPKGEVPPYMSDVVYIPSKVYAKGKPKKVKKKTLKQEYEYLGKFTLTAYCSCSRCCGKWASGNTASGKKAKADRTIATDPKVIPLGTEVVINKKIYVAEDTGGAIKGNRIDVFFDSHSDALDFGRQKAKVYKKKPVKVISKLKKSKRGEIICR
jgi:3D (Asp-Asp-Asp) domain-containing protein